MSDEISLVPDQEQYVLQHWDILSLEELTRGCFKDPNLDGRSKQGRAIKKFLASKKFVPKPAYLKRVPDVPLSDQQKEFIRDNVKKGCNALDMARDIFGDASIAQLSKEHRTVDAYIKSLESSELAGQKPAFLASEDYSPPKTIEGSIQRVNKFNHAPIEKEKLTVPQKKGIEYLTNHLNSPRFLRTINQMIEQRDRDSFESEFIRHIWDKPDLTAEEINLYINLCNDYIMMFKIQAQIEALDNRLREVLNDSNGEVTMRLTEAISVKTKEYDACFQRHKQLIADLTGKRSDRMKKSIQDNSSMLAIIQAWKSEEERILSIRMAQAKEAEAADEVKRLETMEEWKARILGIGRAEAVYGI